MLTTLPVPSGWVVSKKAVEEKGKKYADQPDRHRTVRVRRVEAEAEVRLKRFAGYSGASEDTLGTIWDELVLIPIEENEAAAIALETGEIDFGQLPMASIDRFKENGDFTVEKRTALDYNWIGMNTRARSSKDINVRQAIRYGVDVPSIIEAAFEGRWERATAIIPPGMPIGYWEDAPVYERDVDKAKQYLCRRRAIRPRSSTSGSPTRRARRPSREIVQANLAEVGIDVKLQPARQVGVLRAGREARCEAAALLRRLRDEPGPVLVDRVVHLRPDGRLELDVLVQQGVRPARQRGPEGARPGEAERDVHRDAEALGRGRAHASGSPGRRTTSGRGRASSPRSRPTGDYDAIAFTAA